MDLKLSLGVALIFDETTPCRDSYVRPIRLADSLRVTAEAKHLPTNLIAIGQWKCYRSPKQISPLEDSVEMTTWRRCI